MASPRGVNFDRLRTAVDWSIRQLVVPRNKRIEAIQQFVGYHYAQHGTDRTNPTNLLELAITIYVGRLAARAPRVMVSTGVDHLKPYARYMEIALNQVPDEIDLGRTIRQTVVEAIFGLGVVKVGLCEGGTTFQDHDAGRAFADLVTLDDYFCDMSAKSRKTVQFEGNDYWLSLDDARGLYEGQGSDIEPDDHTVTGDQGEQRAESVSAEEGADLYRDKVWMRDVWLPDTQQVLTYGVKSKKVFRVVPWDGPEHGPYYTLSFADVPGNLLPLPPVALWMDLHVMANTVFRKLGRQAEAKKTVAAFAGGNEKSVDALRSASDGDGIRYDGPKPEMIAVGGIDQATLAFFLQTRDLFSYFAGNLDSLGGLSPMAETAKQDQLLSEAANARLDRMADETIEFVGALFKAVAWYEWTDPVRQRIIQKPMEGTDIVLQRVWSEETREGDFLDYNFEIDAYSMQGDTPALRLQKISQALQQFIFPLLPLIQAQGGQINVPKLLETIARLGNIDELRELVIFSEPIPGGQQEGGEAQPSYKPAETVRTYERINRPGATRHGKDDVLTRLLMGGGVQQSEAASLARPAG